MIKQTGADFLHEIVTHINLYNAFPKQIE